MSYSILLILRFLWSIIYIKYVVNKFCLKQYLQFLFNRFDKSGNEQLALNLADWVFRFTTNLTLVPFYHKFNSSAILSQI
jgi:hypothetical protein